MKKYAVKLWQSISRTFSIHSVLVFFNVSESWG